MGNDAIHEDFAVWLKILREEPWAYGVNEPLLVYRVSRSSKSGNKLKAARMTFGTYRYVRVPLPLAVWSGMLYTVRGIRKFRRVADGRDLCASRAGSRIGDGMKRVCHLTSVHSSDDTRVFHKECVSLARAGYDVTLVAPGESREELGVHIVGVGEKPVGTLNRLTSPFVKYAYEAALALDCELYHLHDPELLPYALKLKRHGKTVIFDSHEFYSLLIQEKGYIPGFLKKPASRIYGALEAGVFKKLDAVIIPCTSFGKNPFEKCAKRTVIVDNLPDAGRFPPPEKLYPDAENTVGYVGGVTAAALQISSARAPSPGRGCIWPVPSGRRISKS